MKSIQSTYDMQYSILTKTLASNTIDLWTSVSLLSDFIIWQYAHLLKPVWENLSLSLCEYISMHTDKFLDSSFWVFKEYPRTLFVEIAVAQ